MNSPLTIGTVKVLRFRLSVLAWVALCMGETLCAGVIVQPMAVSSSFGSFYNDCAGEPDCSVDDYGLIQAINQSGLSRAYTSGTTDFDSYVASATHDGTDSNNTGYTNTDGVYPQTLTFSLGRGYSVLGIALWQTDDPIGEIGSFLVYGDDQPEFSDGAARLLGQRFTAAINGGSAAPAQTFGLNGSNASFIHLVILSTPGASGFPGIGELAFNVTEASTPEPGTWMLLGSGCVALAGWRRRSLR